MKHISKERLCEKTAPDMAPLVTVITPAYNRASYLDETIKSVLGQDYPNFEYIVLDDGSTDNSAEVIAKYEDRIRWESQNNMGETRTVNKGFSMASGEIIGVVNSDDPLLPGAITAAVELLMDEPGLLVVYPDWEYIDKDGEIVENIKTRDYSFVEMVSRFQCVPGPGAFFRREVVQALGGRDTGFRYVADFDFWLRAGMLGPFARIPRPLATFRAHPGSATVSHKGRQMADEEIRLVKKIFSMRGLPAEAGSFWIRHEAFGNAYYKAGTICGDGLKWLRARYYLTSMFYSPWIYCGEQTWRLRRVLSELLGRGYGPLRLIIIRPVFRMFKALAKSVSKPGATAGKGI